MVKGGIGDVGGPSASLLLARQAVKLQRKFLKAAACALGTLAVTTPSLHCDGHGHVD